MLKDRFKHVTLHIKIRYVIIRISSLFYTYVIAMQVRSYLTKWSIYGVLNSLRGELQISIYQSVMQRFSLALSCNLSQI